MKLTKASKNLMSFFLKNNCCTNNVPETKETKMILTELYNDILEAYQYLLSIKNSKTSFYNVNIKKIQHAYQITKPKTFNSNSFPEEIRKHIDELSLSEISYTFSLFERNIKVHFIVEEDNVELNLEKYNKYIHSIIMWLHILNQYASKQCSSNIIIYFYFTSLEKKLPHSNILILNENNVNTAFTRTCPKDSEIVVFRKEEWFKVFIHETFHNFGLDFSDMNTSASTGHILNIFPVKSDVNLYESYTEFWAEIINILFCGFFMVKNKNNIEEFLSVVEILLHFERSYSFFQLVKTLQFMGLQYKDLYSKTSHCKILRDTMYKEKTNVLSYYVIKTILLNNYPSFLLWCKKNNLSLLQFKKTLANQEAYCKFIEKNYKTTSMLNCIRETEKCLIKYNDRIGNNKFLLNNLRMTICELG